MQTDTRTYRPAAVIGLKAPDREDTGSVFAAGAMTFLLSGDLRLAMRATRLLIADAHAPTSSHQQGRVRAGTRRMRRR
jgi:hypothetical protein